MSACESPFKADGTGTGSIAASTQAGIGNVVAGSLFSTLQSAGMGKAGVAVVAGAVKGVGGVMGLGSAASIFKGSLFGRNGTAPEV